MAARAGVEPTTLR